MSLPTKQARDLRAGATDTVTVLFLREQEAP